MLSPNAVHVLKIVGVVYAALVFLFVAVLLIFPKTQATIEEDMKDEGFLPR